MEVILLRTVWTAAAMMMVVVTREKRDGGGGWLSFVLQVVVELPR